jgi:twinkle protein
MELSQIKSSLAARANEVCSYLLPDGRLEKNEWVGGKLADGQGGHSLRIVVAGDKCGVWKDFGGDAGGSNLLELWVQARGLPFQEALAEAKKWLLERGAIRQADIKAPREKTYSKPSREGITWLANKAEFYLLTERRLPKEIIELFKISMTDDEKTIVFPYLHHDAPHGAEMIKYLNLDRDDRGKKVIRASANSPKVLFGKHTVRPEDRYIIITEGEIDAMSYRAVGLTALSVPFGAKSEGKDGRDPNEEWIGNDWDFLVRFERIYLSMDMDDEGKKACASIVKRLGAEHCFVIELSGAKDANEMLVSGRGDGLIAAFKAAKTLDPETLKNATAFKDQALDRMFNADPESRRGIPLPFGKQPFHLRWHEWTAVSGQNGSGKSQLIGWLLIYLAKLGHTSCVASLEVPASQTLEFYITQTLGAKTPTRPAAEGAVDFLGEHLWFYDVVGETKWQAMLEVFRYAYRRHGVRFFVIDSWMKLGIKGDDFDGQGIVCNALSDFVRDYPVHIFVVAHPRKLKDGIAVVNKMDVKGSGELTDQAHNVIVMWRNESKERKLEDMLKMNEQEGLITSFRRAKPDAILMVNKQRNDDGDLPHIDLWFVKECKQFFPTYREVGMNMLADKPVTEVPAQVVADEKIDDDVPF